MKKLFTATLFSALLGLTACGSLIENMRHDVDTDATNEPPVTGGRWAERGLLNAEDDAANARGRAVSSYGDARDRGQGWVNEAQADANMRDAYRGNGGDDEANANDPTSANTPNLLPSVKRLYKNGQRATRADFTDDSQNEGSLWSSENQSNFFFSKNKVHSVGDIVTINMEQDLIKDMGLEIRRGLSPSERDAELALAQERLRTKAGSSDKVQTSAAAPGAPPAATPGAPASTDGSSAPVVREATNADIDVGQSLETKVGDTMMGEIVERYPNGNYKIRAVKKIPYKNGAARTVQIMGIAKGSDIGDDDVVASGKLYEYRIEAIH